MVIMIFLVKMNAHFVHKFALHAKLQQIIVLHVLIKQGILINSVNVLMDIMKIIKYHV